MEMKLVKTKEANGKEVKLYELGRYTVKVIVHESGCTSVGTIARDVMDEYLPTVYCITSLEGDIKGFEVQTTSYGLLSADEIRKVVSGLEEASKVAEILTAEFVR